MKIKNENVGDYVLKSCQRLPIESKITIPTRTIITRISISLVIFSPPNASLIYFCFLPAEGANCEIAFKNNAIQIASKLNRGQKFPRAFLANHLCWFFTR